MNKADRQKPEFKAALRVDAIRLLKEILRFSFHDRFS